MIQALIFDLDGVIADTTEHHYQSWKRLADEAGIPFTRADNDQLRGITRRESLNRLLRGRTLDEATAQDWLRRKNQYFLDSLDGLQPLPGVMAFLHAAREAGLRVGMGSASKNARTVLEKLNLLEYFEAIGDGNVIANSKPAPDVFLWVAGALRIPPCQAIVFEDGEAGIEAALAGGFWTVGIGAVQPERAHVTAVDGFASLDLASLLTHFASLSNPAKSHSTQLILC